MRGMRAMNFRGINLTIPHKVEVLQHLDKITPEAATIGAVNTVVRDGDDLIGTNTDGKGFLTALKFDAKLDPAGKRVVFLCAGGAARAMSVELALAGAVSTTLPPTKGSSAIPAVIGWAVNELTGPWTIPLKRTPSEWATAHCVHECSPNRITRPPRAR